MNHSSTLHVKTVREMHTPPLEECLTEFNFHIFAATETDTHMSCKKLHNSDFTPILPNPATASHPTVLLVDDNAVNLRVLQMYCKKRHLDYICAKDGREAVSIFQRSTYSYRASIFVSNQESLSTTHQKCSR
jgi:PleD family two-component response regulator